MRYEASNEQDPFAQPYAAVPPPPNLDTGKGRFGKGKGKGGYRSSPYDADYGEAMQRPQSDGLIVTRVPAELNSLAMLHRHFRPFGEVVKITSHVEEGKAYVQFADAAAAQAALAVPMFDRPEIVLSWAPKVSKGGRGKGGAKGGDRSGDAASMDRQAENRVLVSDPEEHRRLESNKKQKDDLQARKVRLLGGLTDQMKAAMGKMADESMSEAKREALRSLLLQIKGKIDTLSGSLFPTSMEDSPSKAKDFKGKGKGKKKGKRKMEAADADEDDVDAPGGRWTLDLRTKVLRVTLAQGSTLERLKEELGKIGAGPEQISEIQHDPDAELAFVRFRDRWTAEQVLSRRSELPFKAEWCSHPPPSLPPTAEEEGMAPMDDEDAALAAVAAGEDPLPPREPVGAALSSVPLPDSAEDDVAADGGLRDGSDLRPQPGDAAERGGADESSIVAGGTLAAATGTDGPFVAEATSKPAAPAADDGTEDRSTVASADCAEEIHQCPPAETVATGSAPEGGADAAATLTAPASAV